MHLYELIFAYFHLMLATDTRRSLGPFGAKRHVRGLWVRVSVSGGVCVWGGGARANATFRDTY